MTPQENRAIMIAQMAHQGQSYDIFPYTYHTQMVASIAKELGYDESIVIGCHLHDTIEDTTLSYNKIKATFGAEIAEIVFAVTDELGRTRQERKEKTYPKIRANSKAIIVKLCDRIANTAHSKKYNQQKFDMYSKEFAIFVENLGLNSQENKANADITKALNKLQWVMNS